MLAFATRERARGGSVASGEGILERVTPVIPKLIRDSECPAAIAAFWFRRIRSVLTPPG